MRNTKTTPGFMSLLKMMMMGILFGFLTACGGGGGGGTTEPVTMYIAQNDGTKTIAISAPVVPSTPTTPETPVVVVPTDPVVITPTVPPVTTPTVPPVVTPTTPTLLSFACWDGNILYGTTQPDKNGCSIPPSIGISVTVTTAITEGTLTLVGLDPRLKVVKYTLRADSTSGPASHVAFFDGVMKTGPTYRLYEDTPYSYSGAVIDFENAPSITIAGTFKTAPHVVTVADAQAMIVSMGVKLIAPPTKELPASVTKVTDEDFLQYVADGTILVVDTGDKKTTSSIPTDRARRLVWISFKQNGVMRLKPLFWDNFRAASLNEDVDSGFGGFKYDRIEGVNDGLLVRSYLPDGSEDCGILLWVPSGTASGGFGSRDSTSCSW